MVSGADGVLQSLIDLAGQGIGATVTVRVDGLFIIGQVGTATEYRAALAEKLGRELEIQGFDDAYLHLWVTHLPGGENFTWFRCPLQAVQGLIVHGVPESEPTPGM